MPTHAVTLQGPEGRITVNVQAPEGASDADIRSFAINQVQGGRPAPTQATHGLPSFAGISPAGAQLPLQPELPYAPIPQPFGPELRQTPRSETPFEAAKAATAGEMLRLKTGAERLGLMAQGRLEESAEKQAQLGDIRREQSERFEEFPISTLAGSTSPYMALPTAMTSTMPRAFGTGFGLGFVGGGGDPLEAALGGAGGAVGYGLGRMAAGPDVQLNEAQLRNLDIGPQLGMRRTPFMRTGSEGLRRAESAMESSPLMTGPISATMGQNQQQLNRIAAESIGETADYVDESLIGVAQDRIGRTMNEIAERATGRVDDQFLDELAMVDEPIRASVVAGKRDVADDLQVTIDNVLDLIEDGAIPGAELAKVSQQMRQEANRLFKNPNADNDLARGYSQISEAVDNLISRTAPEGDIQRLMEARNQWANTRLLEGPGAHSGAGDVNARTVRNMLIRQRPSFRRGRRAGMLETPQDRLNAAIRFQTSTPAGYGSSGTAERLAPAQAAAGWYAGTQATGEPVSGALVGLGAPALFSRLYDVLPGGYPFATGALGPLASPRLVPGLGARTGFGAEPLLNERLR